MRVNGLSLEHWIAIGGCNLAISERGPLGRVQSRGTLLFLHGRLGTGEIFEPVVQRLRAHYRCLILDFPGFGRSYSIGNREHTLVQLAELVEQLVRRLAPEGVSLVGHDTGGAIAQLYAWTQKVLVKNILLINSCSIIQSFTEFSVGAVAWRARWSLFRKFREYQRMQLSIDDPFYSSLRRAWRCKQSRLSMTAALRGLRTGWPGPAQQDEWRRTCKSSHVPTLLLWGAQEWLNPPELALELMRYLPESYFYSCAHAGHWLCLDDPDWLSVKIREFLFRAQPTSQLPHPSWM